ncbi:MAG: FAD-binding protein, partial [Endomicrobium sp.]|nr:FAD-binding protein [Endomicrobium sp.]
GICCGAYAFDKINKKIKIFKAKLTVLACGGSGRMYLHTSNPDISTGDAVAMAYRAGADIANMEFVQFHPTCLYSRDNESFLISEAIRGEGAVLRLKNGKIFMNKYSNLMELDSRDVVARAIDNELKIGKENFVYLDISMKSKDFLIKRFPNIYSRCLECGIDISRDMIPVVPAAHFFCGGIAIDENGRTSIKNLYALGENACSGVHGANRLASNSMLECIVYADRVCKDSIQFLKNKHLNFGSKFIEDIDSLLIDNESRVPVHEWEKIKKISWNYLGISRSNEKLLKAKSEINFLKNKIDERFSKICFSINNIELKNIVLISEIVAFSAICRKESRGAHFNVDYPFVLDDAKNTIINMNIVKYFDCEKLNI